ncbi:hypothetical protein EPR50_G00244160 [Perca flavescens]|uniref:Uncharacterized protein n=1 Tax=Perca flavescens TaxID=8167 RepID=A0A484BXQ8_PERFV|nr:hypothetical protein EPR50_G00244160 [Perca flavescens]
MSHSLCVLLTSCVYLPLPECISHFLCICPTSCVYVPLPVCMTNFLCVYYSLPAGTIRRR